IFVTDRIYHKVIMQTLSIKMCCDYHLETVAPESLGQCNTNLMCLLWSRLTFSKTLIRMEGYRPVFFSKSFLRCVELFLRKRNRAVYCRYEELLLCLILVRCILNYIC